MYESLKTISHLVQDKIDVKAIYSVYGATHILDFISKTDNPYSLSIECNADKLSLKFHFKPELNREFDYVDVEHQELFNDVVDEIVNYFDDSVMLDNAVSRYKAEIGINKEKADELLQSNKDLVLKILWKYQQIKNITEDKLGELNNQHDNIVNPKPPFIPDYGEENIETPNIKPHPEIDTPQNIPETDDPFAKPENQETQPPNTDEQNGDTDSGETEPPKEDTPPAPSEPVEKPDEQGSDSNPPAENQDGSQTQSPDVDSNTDSGTDSDSSVESQDSAPQDGQTTPAKAKKK